MKPFLYQTTNNNNNNTFQQLEEGNFKQLSYFLKLASEHALMHVLRGCSIFWVRVNLEHLL